MKGGPTRFAQRFYAARKKAWAYNDLILSLSLFDIYIYIYTNTPAGESNENLHLKLSFHLNERVKTT